MKKIIFILTLLVSVTSCRKDLKEPRILQGRILLECGVPASNVEFFISSTPNYFGNNQYTADFTTDSLGYFTVLFFPKSSTVLRIRRKKGSDILKDIPFPKANEVINVGIVYDNFTYKTVVRLNVTNPYTANDTLYYGQMLGKKWRVGPFESMIIDTLDYNKTDFLKHMYGYKSFDKVADFHIRSNGQILFTGQRKEDGIMTVPAIDDVCENGTLGEEIYYIR